MSTSNLLVFAFNIISTFVANLFIAFLFLLAIYHCVEIIRLLYTDTLDIGKIKVLVGATAASLGLAGLIWWSVYFLQNTLASFNVLMQFFLALNNLQ